MLPTRVGMDRALVQYAPICQHAPHTRGDGPEWQISQSLPRKCSPHAWGWTARSPPHGGHGSMLPTRVGMDRDCAMGSI